MPTCSARIRVPASLAATRKPLLAAIAWLATFPLAASAADAPLQVPPELRDWQGWVLLDHEAHRCPWLATGASRDEERICAWPGVLETQADAHGARFSQRWQVMSDSWVALPGSGEVWPEAVNVDGHPGAVVLHARAPMLRLGVGAHVITGRFSWTRRPDFCLCPHPWRSSN